MALRRLGIHRRRNACCANQGSGRIAFWPIHPNPLRPHADTSPPSPGSLFATIGTVSDSSLSGTASVWSVSLVSPLSLAVSTRYRVGLSTTNNATSQWSYASTSLGTGVASEYFSNSLGTFANLGDGPYQMAVSVTAIPEPSLYAMALVGLASGGLSMWRLRKKA